MVALELAGQISPSLSYHALNVKGAAQLTLGDAKGAEASLTPTRLGLTLTQRDAHLTR